MIQESKISAKKTSPTKLFTNLYSISLQDITFHERKELLDLCIRKRRIEIRTTNGNYSLETITNIPLSDFKKTFYAILYNDFCPTYFISSKNIKDAMNEIEISGPNVWIILLEK